MGSLVIPLVIRRYNNRDIPLAADYLFSSPKDFLEAIGFDTAKLGAKSHFIATMENTLRNAAPDAPPKMLVGEPDGHPFGVVTYDIRNTDEPTPRLHFHIWKPEFRGKGLGGPLFSACAEIFSSL